MKKGKLLRVVLIILTLGLIGCGSTIKETVPKKTVKLKWAFFGTIPDMSYCGKALNEKLKSKGLPYEIEFESIYVPFEGDYGDYVQAYADAVKSGNYDLVNCSGSVSSYVIQEVLAEQNVLLPLRDRIEESREGKKLKAAYPDNVWEAVSYQGEIYGAATLRGDYRYYAVFNKKYAEKYGIDKENVSFQNLGELLRKVTEGERAADNDNFVGCTSLPYFLQGDYEFSRCELICINTEDGTSTAENILENKDFLNWTKNLNQWQKEGFMTLDTMSRQMVKGNFFVIGEYSYSPMAAILRCRNNYNISSDVELQAVELPEFRKSLSKTESVTGIAANSHYPDEAFKALAAIYTDPDLSNAIVYGEENLDYTLEDGRVVWLNDHEEDMRSWYFGNSLLTLPAEKDSSEKKEELWDTVKDLKVSAQEALSCDEKLIENISVINSWYVNNYSFVLSGDSQNLKEDLEQMRTTVKKMGMDDILGEFNRQFHSGEDL